MSGKGCIGTSEEGSAPSPHYANRSLRKSGISETNLVRDCLSRESLKYGKGRPETVALFLFLFARGHLPSPPENGKELVLPAFEREDFARREKDLPDGVPEELLLHGIAGNVRRYEYLSFEFYLRRFVLPDVVFLVAPERAVFVFHPFSC